ncbi:hypothetical protein IMZ31_23735 (plasmid) [Pontibacillus sp. ALD_SL1]|uniref:hypothetical protein n=1 Tax=Pontibacillus sp. ALD_SL1 TaxID=2777185 RepID=UPI001A95A893|nr:hypothetical protein [Pontibacillus sp. ALD_SL1]QST02464.1 hypothetical protein IMZ31_23735 [Pontibacillus sp. ALD_SL1]
MSNRYEEIFEQSADSWDGVTPSVVETMFERAEGAGMKLRSFKKWLVNQPLTAYTKSRVEGIYESFCD